MRKEATALSRAKVLRPILEIEEQGFPVSCALEDAAHDLGLSKSHTWRLYRRMKANDARSSALDLQRRGPKKGTRRLSGEVEQIIECSLRQYFLVRERPSFLRVVGEIRAECVAKGFTPPARETIKARLDAMDQREVLRKRTGAKAAAKVFAARPGHLNVEHPLEVVQIDHTPADIILVDHVERLPLNRPFLTLAIDVATRIILGAYVSFDPPSVLSVALCLDHCVRPKSVQVPNALEELAWPTSGIPKAIFVDNGQEFHSAAFKLACEEWGIGIEYRPAGGAHYGGHIERLIGTTMGAVHVLPGTTQSSTLEKGDYDSSKHAALTLSEFDVRSLCQSLRIGFILRFAVTTIPRIALWDGHRLRLGLILVVTMQAGASSIRKLSESASCRLSAVGSVGRVSLCFRLGIGAMPLLK